MSVAHGGATTLAMSPSKERPAEAQPSDQAPGHVREGQPAAGWVWFGLHGGAGVSTLGDAVPGGIDVGRSLDARPGLPIVAVCRSHAGGLAAAQAWVGGRAHLPVVGLVVVADAPGPLPRGLKLGVRLVAGGYRQLWRVPWVPAWRMGQPVEFKDLPAAVRQLADDLAARTARRGGK